MRLSALNFKLLLTFSLVLKNQHLDSKYLKKEHRIIEKKLPQTGLSTLHVAALRINTQQSQGSGFLTVATGESFMSIYFQILLGEKAANGRRRNKDSCQSKGNRMGGNKRNDGKSKTG